MPILRDTGIDPTWAEVVAGGGYASREVARGTHLRLTDLRGDACAHLLLFNAAGPWERLHVADTGKVPWRAYPSTGHPLLSDQGRALATIVADDGGRHDALCGTSSRTGNVARYGAGDAHSESPAGRDLLIAAALKHGLAARDVAPSISFFQGVRVQPDGVLDFVGSAGPGVSLTLRAELPLVVLLANVPHPLDPRDAYTCTALEVLAWRGSATSPDDPLWSSSPELEHALVNTAAYVAARGL